MQFMIRSLESSSIGTVTNFDWPTRIIETIINMASALRELTCGLSSEISAQRITSLVSAEERTEPV